MRALIGLTALSLAAGCAPKGEPAPAKPVADATATPTPPAPTPAPVAKSAPKPPARAGLPGADRVFAVDLDGDGIDEVLGADKGGLWAADPAGTVRWRSVGPGVVQRVVMGPDYQGLAPQALYVARGVGRGFLDAPLVVQRLDPKSGTATVVWQHTGPRNEVAHLGLADTNGDGKIELVVAHYASKYMVKVRSWDAAGPVLDGPEVRMASSHALGDVDGDSTVDHAVGRVYGDARGEPGDLGVALKSGPASVPTDKGIKAMLITQLTGAPHASLFFADGWVANYGKEAKAQLKQARWSGGKLTVSEVGNSSDEFTFFGLTAVDVGGDGVVDIVAQGNKRFTVFTPGEAGWTKRPVGGIDAVLNTAVGRQKGGVFGYVPNAQGVRAIKL